MWNNTDYSDLDYSSLERLLPKIKSQVPQAKNVKMNKNERNGWQWISLNVLEQVEIEIYSCHIPKPTFKISINDFNYYGSEDEVIQRIQKLLSL